MPGDTYTWEELSKHNTEESAWVAIDGKVYDVTKFIPNHPGGKKFLLLGAGRDCTDLFKSYHPFSKKAPLMLPKYEIGTLVSFELNKFKPDSGFYKECCEEVLNYFVENDLHPKNPIYGLWRLAVMVSVMALCYYITYVLGVNLLVGIIASIIFGTFQGLILVHQMHDASHSSIGYGPKWWDTIGGLTMEWIAGASMTSWHHQHVLGHHIYTNIMGSDPDMPMVDQGDLRYLVKRQIWKNIYKYQHIYMPILYGLLAIKFRIQDFTWTFNSGMNGPIRVNPSSVSIGPYTNLLVTKAWLIIYRVIIPLLVFGTSWQHVLIYFLIVDITTGYFLAFNFQVSHISTEAYFPCDEKYIKDIKDEWAVAQIMGSVDYAHGNVFATFFSGALNYQSVHHLFPGVSQYHYPAIAPIIKEVCKKYKVPFNHVPTFYEALRLHLLYMRNLGNQVK